MDRNGNTIVVESVNCQLFCFSRPYLECNSRWDLTSSHFVLQWMWRASRNFDWTWKTKKDGSYIFALPVHPFLTNRTVLWIDYRSRSKSFFHCPDELDTCFDFWFLEYRVKRRLGLMCNRRKGKNHSRKQVQGRGWRLSKSKLKDKLLMNYQENT